MRCPACLKNWIFCCLLIGIIFSFICSAEAQGLEWNIKKSKHFIIYYRDVSSEYLAKTIKEAEGYYDTVTDYLGFNRYSFWTWDNRCKLYLYGDLDDYQKHVGAAAWSRGHVNVVKKEISTYILREKFFNTILPHEIAHIIFREFVGYDKRLPLWLDEGIACSQEIDNAARLLMAKYSIALDLYTPFEDFSESKIPESVEPLIFYSQAASMLDFLLEDFGRKRFVDFCRRVRDKTEWQKSLLGVYKFRDMQEFERKWIDYLSNKVIKKGVK